MAGDFVTILVVILYFAISARLAVTAINAVAVLVQQASLKAYHIIVNTVSSVIDA